MTLAVIFLNISLALSSVATEAQASPQAGKSADATPTQDQGNAQQQNPPTQSQPAASKPAKKSTTTPTKHKGTRPNYRTRVRPPDCDPAPPTTSASAPTSASPAKPAPVASNPASKAPADTTAGASAATPPPAARPTNCPPPKVIVRQGSTAEPSIQLVGGDATSQRDAANQMLAAADANLKKIAGSQLSSSQQDVIAQIRQFMDQSKKATADGDTEQARTLAWKAKTLSEELIGPPK